MRFRIQTAVRAAILAAVFAAPTAGSADSNDQDEARRAVEAGEILPLAEVLRLAQSELSGEIVRVKIEHKDRLWFYEFRVLEKDGRLLEVYVDARTGEIRRMKEK